jgi:hypothetical protein
MGDCVQPCTDGDCTGNKVCNSELGIPVCIECQGGCDNQTDCAEGCSCVNGVCIKAPDNPDPCTSYLDCPPNHGCLNGICYPCEELSLTDCEVAEGCQPNGDECNPDNPCSGACNESTDCGDGCICIDSVCTPNYGCTDTPCLNYSQCAEGCGCEEELCIPCNSVSCNSTIDCPDGCYCLNGTCTSGDDPDGPNPEPEFPCDSVLCQNSTECGPDCICIEGRCYPCNSFNCATCPDPCICETLTCEGQIQLDAMIY